MINVKNLYFSYNAKQNKIILNNVNFSISRGKLVTILGPNGSGKTTVIKNIEKLLSPYQGTILIDGKNIEKLKYKEISKMIAYVHQQHKINFPYKVIDIVLMGRNPELNSFSSLDSKDFQIALNSLKQLGIEDIKDREYDKISGGQLQLVLLARALSTNAKIFLLDEPTAHLDFKNQIYILKKIKTLAKERKFTVIITLHDPNLAYFFSDKILFLKDGKVINYDDTDKIMTEENLKKLYDIDVEIVSVNGKKFILPKDQLTN